MTVQRSRRRTDHPASTDDRTILDALPYAVIATTADGIIVTWNRAAEALYGWTEAEVVGRRANEMLVLETDAERADDVITMLARGESWDELSFIRTRDGSAVHVAISSRPILDGAGVTRSIIGVSHDVSERNRLEHHAQELAEHLELALDAGGLGTWRWDIATNVVLWDARLERLYGLEPGTFAGSYEAYVALLHPEDAAGVIATVEKAVEARSDYTVDHRVVWPDGSSHWLQGKGKVILDRDGAVTGTIGYVGDVTEQAHALFIREQAITDAIEAAEREHLSAQRLRILGHVNEVLASASTRSEVMRDIARVAVPALGEWCAVLVYPDQFSNVPEIEIAHSDPRMVEFARAIIERHPFDPESPSGVAEVMRTGKSSLLEMIDDDMIAAADTTDAGRSLIRAMRFRSALTVPLRKGGRSIGALQFVNTDAARMYGEADLALAEAIASRVTSTLENRRLAEHQRLIATTLQSSLLPTALPEIAGLDIAVRYWAAGEGTEVGGDFYDVFEVSDGRWAAVIGDVCGTGPEAAALTGLTRHTIRAAAWNRDTPDQVLRNLNHAVLRSGYHTFCTALMCLLTATADGFRFEVAAGGHPLPIIFRADGDCAAFGTPGQLLGLLPNAISQTNVIDLAPGDVVVMYTDGITDVRPPCDLTPHDMERIVERSARAALSADDVAFLLGREVDATLPLALRNDDIALLVLKVKAADAEGPPGTVVG